MDPWYDYLALPVAPLLLIIQGITLVLSRRRAFGLVIALAIALMLVFVLLLGLPSGGANIGAGLLLFWLMGSGLLLGIALLIPSGASGR